MERSSRGPRPPPQPVCNNNCGKVQVNKGGRVSEITCPCGFGYYNRQTNKFVQGSLVRDGKAPTREEYVTHVRQCPQQEEGSPILIQTFLGVRKEDGTIVPAGSSYPSSSQIRAETVPEGTAEDQRNPQRVDKINHIRSSGPGSLSDQNGLKQYFVPRANIEREALEFYLELCGCGKIDLQSHRDKHNSKDGWVLKGVTFSVDKPTWQKLLREVMNDSEAWQEEILSTEDNSSYPESDTAARRRRRGTVKLSQDTRGTSSSTEVSKPSQAPNRRNMVSAQYEPVSYDSETSERSEMPGSFPNALAKTNSRRGEKKYHLEERQVTSGTTRSERPRDSSHNRVDSGVSLRSRKSSQPKKRVQSEDEDDDTD